MTRINAKLRVKLPNSAGYLTPYRREHVERYHAWLECDEELRRLTGTEQQTLQEEQLNQVQWRDDADKCTFIVTDAQLKPVGDVNLFLSADDDDEEEDEEGDKKQTDKKHVKAEINVMIADKAARGKGMGRLAVLGMCWFALQRLPLVRTFDAKIQLDNLPSLALFTSKLGFKEVSRSDAFQEATLRCTASEMRAHLASLATATAMFEEQPCVDEETEALRLRGNLAFEAREFVQAIRLYDQAIRIDGRDEVLRSNRSAARLRSGELFGALSDASIATTLCPTKYAKAHLRLGNAWAALGMEDKAKLAYRVALREGNQQHLQDQYDELAKKSSLMLTPAVAASPVMPYELKLAPAAVEVEVAIEVSSSMGDARAVRFGCILYLWNKLTGEERRGVYDECARAGYAPADDADNGGGGLITPELLERAPAPRWPGASKDVPVCFVRYVQALPAGMERVAALVLLFEGCSFEERDIVGRMLIEVILTQAPQEEE